MLNSAIAYYGVAILGGGGLALAVTVPFYEWLKRFVEKNEGVLGKKLGGVLENPELVASLGTAVFGAFLGMSFALGARNTLIYSLLGAAAGYAASKVIGRIKRQKNHFIRLRELAVICEGLDLFSRAKFTVPQALELMLSLVTTLKPAVRRCLDRWPAGPMWALEEMGKEIGVKEASILTGVLMQAQEVGAEKIAGILEQEALRLEDLRRSLAEARVAAKPVYATIYTFLPVAALLGIVLGALTYRAINMLLSIQAVTSF